jgi:hypothetical protein
MITELNKLLKGIIIVLLIGSTSCINKENNNSVLKKKNNLELNKKNSNYHNLQQYYHYSSANNQKYDHHVVGKDENGKNVNGVINIENEIAIGILKANDGNEIEIISDQINTDRIIATDANGFIYRLKMD